MHRCRRQRHLRSTINPIGLFLCVVNRTGRARGGEKRERQGSDTEEKDLAPHEVFLDLPMAPHDMCSSANKKFRDQKKHASV